MMICRACSSKIAGSYRNFAGPSVTSIATIVDFELSLFICEDCGHVQSPAHTDLQDFYENDYRISLVSDDHDQIYSIEGERVVYRTQQQAEIVRRYFTDNYKTVLDYGAGKASTLKRLCELEPGITPYVFDVSDDYKAYWAEWIPERHQSTHVVPESWNGLFDLITAHFVLEHVEQPVELLSNLRKLLRRGGKIVFTVPNFFDNTGDLLVVDHINHFTESSLRRIAFEARLSLNNIESVSFRGAYVVELSNDESVDIENSALTHIDTESVKKAIDRWTLIINRLCNHMTSDDEQTAVYGAGFYGALVASKLSQTIVGFFDSNPTILSGSKIHCGRIIMHPTELTSDIKYLFVGLNPKIARQVMSSVADCIPKSTEIIYLDV